MKRKSCESKLSVLPQQRQQRQQRSRSPPVVVDNYSGSDSDSSSDDDSSESDSDSSSDDDSSGSDSDSSSDDDSSGSDSDSGNESLYSFYIATFGADDGGDYGAAEFEESFGFKVAFRMHLNEDVKLDEWYKEHPEHYVTDRRFEFSTLKDKKQAMAACRQMHEHLIDYDTEKMKTTMIFDALDVE